MNTIANSQFSNQRVQLDNMNYVGCRFSTCVMVYSGLGPIGLNSCDIHNCRWEFEGAAGNTLKFLTLMHKANPEFIEAVIAGIRSGRHPDAAATDFDFPDTIS
jgi:hypothetical protein